MVPQFLVLDALERNEQVKVMVTQPRRVAAVALARRISRQIGGDLGSKVGYKIGSGDRSATKDSLITVATAGHTLKYFSGQPQKIHEYTHIVLDEVHERGIDMDLLNLLFKKILENGGVGFKLILMSATFQAEAVTNYFALDGISQTSIHVGESPFNVRTIFLDDLAEYMPCPRHLASMISNAVVHFDSAAQAQNLAIAKPHVRLSLKYVCG